MSRTERIMVRLTPEEKEAAARAAKANGRSVSNLHTVGAVRPDYDGDRQTSPRLTPTTPS